MLSVLKWLVDNRLGMFIFTRRHGKSVGEDAFGNRYYRKAGAKSWRYERRWVVYRDGVSPEGSLVPSGWSAWLHHNFEFPPEEMKLTSKHWEKEHLPNLTGTELAYVPEGHALRGGQRAPATGDYEAWKP